MSFFVLYLGPDDGDVGDGAGGDPHLFAVEHVLVADFAGAGAHAAGVGAEVGLGEAEAAELLAGGQLRQPVVLLLVGAEGVDRIHDQRRLHADEAADAGVAALQLLHDQAVLDIGHAGAAVAFDGRAEEAQFAHGLDQFAREAAVAIALLDDGNEVVFDKVAGGVASEALFFREQVVESEKIYAFELKCHLLSDSNRNHQPSRVR